MKQVQLGGSELESFQCCIAIMRMNVLFLEKAVRFWIAPMTMGLIHQFGGYLW